MDVYPVVRRLGRLITALVPKVEKLNEILEASTFLMTDLAACLDTCSESLLSVETLLTPAYVTSSAGVRFTPHECASIAQLTGPMMSSPLAHLLKYLMDFLIHEGGILGSEPETISSEERSRHGAGTSQNHSDSKLIIIKRQHACAALVCVRISTLVTRVLFTVHLTLKYMGSQLPEYLALLHYCHVFPRCCALLSITTLDLCMLGSGNALFIADQQDRVRVFLCGAMLSCTLGEYCHAVYGDIRWSSSVTEEVGKQGLSGLATPDPRPSKKEVWEQLLGPQVHSTLHKVTEYLTTAAQVGTFYQHQTPMYQSLLTPSLGLESLVSLEVCRVAEHGPDISGTSSGSPQS